jgi:hypothetical protein
MKVEYAGGRCLVDGHAADRAEVEARQAQLTERVLSRQPLFVIVTLLIVVLAGFSHIEKLVLLFSTRTEAHGLGARLRAALDRYRAHPIRYFAIVVATLTLLGMAGGFYVYLDADKRASERALGLLQFCHLALRDQEAQDLLADERRNLESLQHTAGGIKEVLGQLPPEEQKKAQEIVARIDDALVKQGKLVSLYVERSDAAGRAQAEAVARGFTSLESDLGALRALPAGVRAVDDRLHAVDDRVHEVGAGVHAVDERVRELESKVAAMSSARPTCLCEWKGRADADGGVR